MDAKPPLTAAKKFMGGPIDRSDFYRFLGINLLWVTFSYIDINIIVHYTARVIDGLSCEVPLFILYPISFSLMAGTVRWAFLWQAHKKNQQWLAILTVMLVNASVEWMLLLALSPDWVNSIRAFWFTVAMMTITGGIFGAGTGILLANGLFDSPQSRYRLVELHREQVESARA